MTKIAAPRYFLSAAIVKSAMSGLLALVLLLTIPPAMARDGMGRSDDPAIAAWFGALMQPDDPRVSCCGEADAYWADSYEVAGNQYLAIVTDERPDLWVDALGNSHSRLPVPVGRKYPIPPNKIKFDKGNPTGHGIIFISAGGAVLCYLPPGGV